MSSSTIFPCQSFTTIKKSISKLILKIIPRLEFPDEFSFFDRKSTLFKVFV